MSNSSPGNRRRFAIVGLGHRARIYSQALLDIYADRGRLVALLLSPETKGKELSAELVVA